MSTSPSDPPPVPADYYDGRSARAHKVTLTLVGDRLRVGGAAINREEPLHALRVSEPMGAAPRLISFPGGAHCEVRDHAALDALLERSGHVDGWVVRMQQRWRAALAAVVITAFTLVAGYYWGLPALSEWIAFKVPDQMLQQLGGGTLEFLDRTLQPTKLPAARQGELRAAFSRLVAPSGAKARHDILFRQGRGIGANALALPDGTILVTDELVKLAGSDEEILAVLAHELGHLDRRHSLRMLIQGSIVAFVVAWYLGDVSSVAAGFPTLLLQLRYSREHEREADRYAAALLKANGISPRRLGDMLGRLEAAHFGKAEGKGVPPQEGNRRRSSMPDYYSSHPATQERIEALSQ
jgi:Zn-dependent protease with chaperone function